MNRTKLALSESLKSLMDTMLLDKITIQDVTTHANLSRNTFYYHFADINELLEWTYDNDIVNQLESFEDIKSWKQGLLNVLNYTENNRKFCLNTFHSLKRDQLETFLYQITYDMLIQIMTDSYDSCVLDHHLKHEIADFYGRGIVAQVIHWLLTRLEEPKDQVIQRIERVTTGSIDLIINNQLNNLE